MMVEEDDLFKNVTTAALELIGDNPPHIPNVRIIKHPYPVLASLFHIFVSVRGMGVKVDRFRENQCLSCFQHLVTTDMLDFSCLERRGGSGETSI